MPIRKISNPPTKSLNYLIDNEEKKYIGDDKRKASTGFLWGILIIVILAIINIMYETYD